MTWTSIVSGALRLLNALATYFNNKQLMDAGEAKAESRMSAEELRRIDRANTAAIAARNADRVPDSFNRD